MELCSLVVLIYTPAPPSVRSYPACPNLCFLRPLGVRLTPTRSDPWVAHRSPRRRLNDISIYNKEDALCKKMGKFFGNGALWVSFSRSSQKPTSIVMQMVLLIQYALIKKIIF